jgi:DNA invertase Pin-like site-specific DNA recombinase
MAAIYGYARCSSLSQNLSIQEDALRTAGCTVIRSEKVSGTSMQGRSELETLLAFIRAGDTLTVTRLDRLGRSVIDLHRIVGELKSKQAHLRVIEQPVDTSTPSGEAFFGMLSVFAQFETSLRKERQAEGIEKAKADGVYKGRPVSLDADRIRALKADGLGASAIARALGIGRASVYRHLDQAVADQHVVTDTSVS